MVKSIITSLYYYPLKLYVTFTSLLYFRKIRVLGLGNIPIKGPVIYAITHQNSLLDAYLSNGFSWRNPYYLVRASAFNNKIIDKIMRAIKTLPVYRIRDGYESVKKNDEIFEITKGILSKGGVVAIFPEGSHSNTYKLRPLKKGIARLAFKAEAAENFNLNIQIVPIGINYESYTSSRSRTLVMIGKPFGLSAYKQTFYADENKAYRDMLDELSDRMKSLIVHIDSTDYDRVCEDYKKLRVYKKDLKEQLTADQELVQALENGEVYRGVSDKQHVMLNIFRKLMRRLRRIISYIPRIMVNSLVKRQVKDKSFVGTMKFTYSMVIYPLFFASLYYACKYWYNSF